MNSIFIVEDHPIMQNALIYYFEKTGRWQVTGKAFTLAEAKKLSSKSDFKADVVLLDIQLADDWGLDYIPWYRDFTERKQDTIFAVYTNFNDYNNVKAALAMGVQAFICKHRDEQELENALLLALDGKTYIDDDTHSKFEMAKDIYSLLTKRETEILSLVKSGLSNGEIADKLKIKRHSVENIIYCIYQKTGMKSRLEFKKL